jgi:hypothetical protein
MNFEEWLGKYGPLLAARGVTPVERRQMKMAWDAAIEEAAILVASKYDELEPWIEPDDIRKLSSNDGD